MKNPKYNKLTFSNEQEFIKWLTETSHMIIEFVDTGLDLQRIYIDREGEILHANLQTAIWCGKFVDLDKIEIGKPIFIFFPDELNNRWVKMERLVIDNITDRSI